MDRIPPTPRQLQILEMYARGMSRDEIADELFLSPATIRTQVQLVRTRLGARTICEALAVSIACGYLGVDGRRQVVYIPEPLSVLRSLVYAGA